MKRAGEKADYLPGAPRYYRVRFDASAKRRGASGAPKVLTYHSFTKLKQGDRVCIKSGVFRDEFGTVVRRSLPRRGYSHRIAPARTIHMTTAIRPFPDANLEFFCKDIEVG